ncbi:vomeronasal type-1 receptor 1-like [Gracilinanus agilis]|uniref:vomeronasal type-1 receptor 1-like n=1 Tax=Gracilinanus agilis TaxID=191870 RepID=UPI001CFDC5BA|nr:vomeronasal type-1 receptor 1-like [Gracilinanus agilis]
MRTNSSSTASEKIIFLNLVLGIASFIQTGAGMLGNFFLLCHYIFIFLFGQKLRPIDFIFFHLALANSIMLISKGVPQTIVGLGLKISLGHVWCKLIIFVHRVARSLSLSLTCLLSGFQIITISPSTFSVVSDPKAFASKLIKPLCLSCWILHILINVFVHVNMKNFIGSSNDTRIWHMGFCSHFIPASFKVSLFAILYCIPDFLYVGFMMMVSGSLVLLLQRHHHQVRHIHRSGLLSKRSPEIRATYTILVFVSTYVSFTLANSILSVYLFQFDRHLRWLIPTSALLVASFPAISPFVLISCDSQILHFFYSLWGKKRSQDSFP